VHQREVTLQISNAYTWANQQTRGKITQDDPYQYACVSNLGALLLHVPHGTVPRAARKAKNSR
jgi:hypothetical protein